MDLHNHQSEEVACNHNKIWDNYEIHTFYKEIYQPFLVYKQHLFFHDPFLLKEVVFLQLVSVSGVRQT